MSVGLVTEIDVLRAVKDAPRLNLFVGGPIEAFRELHTDADDVLAALVRIRDRIDGARPDS